MSSRRRNEAEEEGNWIIQGLRMYRTNIVRVISTANYGTKGKSTAQREEGKKLNDVKTTPEV